MKVVIDMKNQIKRKGCSLIELIAVMAILTIAYGIIFEIFTTQTRIYSNEMVRNDVQNSARLCLSSISDSIQLASYSKENINIMKQQNTFDGLGQCTQIVSVNNGEYTYVINNRRLFKYVNSTNYTMISGNVDDITITQNNIYEIDVNITGKHFYTEVSLRSIEMEVQ
ncbi:PilW family protein [Clostridium pasteurianum]|uniref:Prepilin-type N-terminal cleavage/methylation domain-containing protein n=1 Tax=Clostridium pasteurianum BC1 TaxID=86416 RepID=R4KCE7_CLOPA|nr:type II secretion system protein [Clostridium pasteurianum]AGK98204.1 hypothetical protein Clopa_3410 [Clostridium pasteurianum BC1]